MQKIIVFLLSAFIIMQIFSQYQPASLKCQAIKKLVDNALKNNDKKIILQANLPEPELKFIALVLFYAQNDDALALFWAYIALELIKSFPKKVEDIATEIKYNLQPLQSPKNLQRFLTENSQHFATGLEQAIDDLIKTKNLIIKLKITISDQIQSLIDFLVIECNLPKNIKDISQEAVKYATQFSYHEGSNSIYDTLLRISKNYNKKLTSILLKTFIYNKKFAHNVLEIIFNSYDDPRISKESYYLNLEILEILVDAGISINKKTKTSKKNALMIALENNNIHLVKKLIQTGIRIDDQDEGGETALIKTVDLGNYEIFKELLNHSIGTRINIKDNYRASALAHAVYNLYKTWVASQDVPNTKKLKLLPEYEKYKNMIKDLVGAGAAVNDEFSIFNARPYTYTSVLRYKPLDYADAISDDKEIANLLRSKGAQKRGTFSKLKQFYNVYIKNKYKD